MDIFTLNGLAFWEYYFALGYSYFDLGDLRANSICFFLAVLDATLHEQNKKTEISFNDMVKLRALLEHIISLKVIDKF